MSDSNIRTDVIFINMLMGVCIHRKRKGKRNQDLGDMYTFVSYRELQ